MKLRKGFLMRMEYKMAIEEDKKKMKKNKFPECDIEVSISDFPFPFEEVKRHFCDLIWRNLRKFNLWELFLSDISFIFKIRFNLLYLNLCLFILN